MSAGQRGGANPSVVSNFTNILPAGLIASTTIANNLRPARGV